MGRIFECPKERVRQIEARALRRLRKPQQQRDLMPFAADLETEALSWLLVLVQFVFIPSVKTRRASRSVRVWGLALWRVSETWGRTVSRHSRLRSGRLSTEMRRVDSLI
eukprot:scaffold103073_cov69-Phaeocystis_antarctica.AAC.2